MKYFIFGTNRPVELNISKFIGGFLSGLGAWWLVVELISALFSQFKSLIEVNSVIVLAIMVLVSLAYGLYVSVTRLSRVARINGTDIVIEVTVGDIFAYKEQSALVISTNTTFDTCTDNNFISKTSLQGLLCETFYNGSWRDMDALIDESLASISPIASFADGRKSKLNIYPVGTVAHIRKDKVHFYLLAFTTVSKNGRASANFQDVQGALTSLWSFIANHGEQMGVAIPLIGMGNARVHATKADIIQEIVQSFIAAASQGEKRFTNHLRIVIHVDDYRNGDIALEEIAENLRCFCRLARRNSDSKLSAGVGTPVGGS